MRIEDAVSLGSRLITSGDKHPDYLRVVELAEKYLILSTGENIGKLLRRFVRRESEEDFKERENLTKSITPAVCEALEIFWNKIIRNERVKKGLALQKEANVAKVDAMKDGFYGSRFSDSNSKGLDYWFKTRYKELTFCDPNAWIAIEWAPAAVNEVFKPYPFEIPAANALNFSIINDEVQWLFCDQKTQMLTSAKPGSKMAEGVRYTLYDADFTVVWDQVDLRWYNEVKPALGTNQTFVKLGRFAFIQSIFEPKVGFATVFRIGYKRDRATASRTFINPWHKALPFLEKSLKTVSELDLTMTLHAFPQKIQYAYKCNGPSMLEKCKDGRLMKGGGECPACKGLGYKFHTSANDAMILQMPEDPKDVFDLEKLIVYKTPPVDLIKWQNDYVLQLKAEAAEAIFTKAQPAQKSGGASGAATGSGMAGTATTATEVDTNMQGVYDALEPFTEGLSALYKGIVLVMAILAGEDAKEVTVIHSFPADFKMKTMDILLADLKAANDSGAPSFLRDAINTDLAEVVFTGDDNGLLKYRTKRRYFPFNGKATDEIEFLVNTTYVAQREKILYANFESIFQEIERETPDFYFLKTPAQDAIVEEKIQEWITAAEPVRPTLGIPPIGEGGTPPPSDAGGNGTGDGGAAGDPNNPPPVNA